MPLIRVSASQVVSFRNCNRFWFYTKILKERTPQSAAQSKGTIVHAALEAYLKGGVIPPEILARAAAAGITEKMLQDFVEVIKPYVGKPGEGLTEYEDIIPTYKDGPAFVLVVDHAREVTVENYGVIPEIDDLKTTSDFRYCKTPDELGKDVQMISYGRWALYRGFEEQDLPLPNFVSLRHVYARTRGKCVGTARDTLVTPDHIFQQWEKILDTIREMVVLSDKEDRDPANVPATTTGHCDAYGGCYFRSKCFGALYDGGKPFTALFNKMETTVENKDTNGTAGPRLSLADRLRLKNAGGAAQVQGQGAAPAATIPTGQDAVAPAAAATAEVSTAKLCGVVNAGLHVPCTLVPHSGDHESRSEAGGVVSWTQDNRSMALGPSTNWKPASAGGMTVAPLAPLVAAPPVAPAVSDTPHVLPPDAASRTTTPEEVAAAAGPKKRGRPAKAVADAAAAPPDAALAAAPQTAPATPAVAATPGICPLETLYIDSFPVKNGGVVPTMAEALIAELAAAAAQAAGVPDWRLVEFGKGKGAMAVVLRERLAQMPRELVVSTSTPGADVVIEVLAPHAKKIVKALRG